MTIVMCPRLRRPRRTQTRFILRTVGGYRSFAIGEDSDLVARSHRHLLEKGRDYRIEFVPDPVCWTEVPSDLRSLGRQRARWQKGLQRS